MVNIPFFTGFYTSQVVVWDFFHQQYLNLFFVAKVCQLQPRVCHPNQKIPSIHLAHNTAWSSGVKKRCLSTSKHFKMSTKTFKIWKDHFLASFYSFVEDSFVDQKSPMPTTIGGAADWGLAINLRNEFQTWPPRDRFSVMSSHSPWEIYRSHSPPGFSFFKISEKWGSVRCHPAIRLLQEY